MAFVAATPSSTNFVLVERQIQKIFPLAGNQIFDERHIVGLRMGNADGQPMPSVFGFHIEIQTADANGGGIGLIQPWIRHGPAGADCRRVSDEAHAHAGGVATQIPDGLAHDAFGLGGQPVVICLGIVPPASLDLESLDV